MKKIMGLVLLLVSIKAVAQNNAVEESTVRLCPDLAQLQLNYEIRIRVCAGNPDSLYPGIPAEWTVNGVVNGNSLVGEIIRHPSYLAFKAPSKKPANNPVEIVATYKNVNINGTYSNRKITCHVQILEAGWTMRLDPDSAHLQVREERSMGIVFEYKIENQPVSEGGGSIMYTQGWHFSEVTPNPPTWTVNGIVNGDDLTGKIIMNTSEPYSVIFKAPARKPVKNPVEIVATYKDLYLNGKRSDEKLASHIWIGGDSDSSGITDTTSRSPGGINSGKKEGYSRFEVRMEANITGGSVKAWTGLVTYHDEGSFVVSLEKNNYSLTNIENKLEVFTNNCAAKTILNPTTCTGTMHVAGARLINVTPANPPSQPYPIVEIWFLQHPVELTRYTQTCPPPPGVKENVTATIDLTNMAMRAFMGTPAIPQYLKFIAKDEEQVILESPKDFKEIYYKIWVRKMKE